MNTQSTQHVTDILSKASNTAPKKIVEALIRKGVPLSQIPSTTQISNMKSALKLNRGDDSPHRLETLHQLKEYFCQWIMHSQEKYDDLGEKTSEAS